MSFELDALFTRAAGVTEPGQWTLLAAAFDAAAGRADSPQPPVDACLRMILRLHQAGDRLSAGKLERSFRAWLTSAEGRAGAAVPLGGGGALTDEQAARWKQIGELGRPGAAPAPGGPPPAGGPAPAAPANDLNAVLNPGGRIFPGPPPPPPQRNWGGLAAIPAILIALAFFRVCASTSRRREYYYEPPRLPDISMPRELPDFSSLYERPVDWRFRFIALQAGELERSARANENDAVALSAGRLREHANAGDCAALGEELRLLDQALRKSDAWAEAERANIGHYLVEVCPGEETNAPPPPEGEPPRKKKRKAKPNPADPLPE